MDFDAASGYIIDRLRRELNPTLSYHCVEHSIDVLEATRRLAEQENVEPFPAILLETAAIYHDAGMIVQYRDHEAASVRLAEEILPGFGYSASEINEIAGLILVTRLPQRPYNHLEQIICDADLDYLGRDDFYVNSFKLRNEWQANDIRHNTLQEWFDIQIKFLSDHQYFTKSAMLARDKMKQKHLQELKQVMNKL